MVNIITLLTDFGLRDSYVGQLKGVLLSRAKQPLQMVDVSHEVPPQDIRDIMAPVAIFLAEGGRAYHAAEICAELRRCGRGGTGGLNGLAGKIGAGSSQRIGRKHSGDRARGQG